MISQPTILLVEDDEQIRGLVRSLLEGAGYRVLDAAGGVEAIRLAEQAGSPVDLLLSDMLLPELSGFDLAVLLRDRYPGLQIIFMTGYVEGEIVERCLAELTAQFIDKPFQPAALLQAVNDSLSAASPPGRQF